MLGQNEVAQDRFERALALDPQYVQAAVWLGDLHYRAGRLREAISSYEMALRHSPGDRDLEATLTAWRGEQEMYDRFREVRTEHFSVSFDTSTGEGLAGEAADRLENTYRRVGAAIGVYPSERITVVLYTREQFNTITRLTSWSAAAYDGRIRIPIAVSPEEREDLDRLLSHEFVHALVAMLGGRTVPGWLNEGLATVLEPAGSEDAEAPLARTRARPNLAKLHDSFINLSREDAEIAYASAARAVRRLLEQRGASAVVALLQDLAQGRTFAAAFRQRTDVPYEFFAETATR
jgi:tetratricopeptide (TPR) repeat protein